MRNDSKVGTSHEQKTTRKRADRSRNVPPRQRRKYRDRPADEGKHGDAGAESNSGFPENAGPGS